MNAADGGERMQQFKRRDLRRPLIVLRARLEDQRRAFFGYARNLSRGGMFISTVNPSEPGSRFQLEFRLPGDAAQIVRCECEVVWSRLFRSGIKHLPGMGLRFLDLPEEIAGRIDAWALRADPTPVGL